MDHIRQNQSTKLLENVRNSEIAVCIDEYIRSERDRNILKRRMIDGITYECLAEEFDMSVRQIKNIVYKGQDKVAIRICHDMGMK